MGFYHKCLNNRQVGLHIMIESPSSLIALQDICYYGIQSLKHLTLQVVVFGSDDFLATIGNMN